MRLLPDNQRRRRRSGFDRIEIGAARRRQPSARGFTLIELIVVLVIIGLLAAVSLPALKNVRQNNTMVAAGRQLVDDLALARARAINERTVVYVVFVPPDIISQTFNVNTKEGKLAERLKSGLYTSYALFAERTVGDQPGRGQSRYLTSWRSLPQGVFVSTNKLWDNSALINVADDLTRTLDYTSKPFPSGAVSNSLAMPYLAFDPQGRLVDQAKQVRLNGEILPLARGSIIYSRADDGTLLDIDVRESPPGNASDTNSFHIVRIDGLTGRARVETRAIY